MENNSSSFFKYFSMDLYRAFFSWRFIIATIFIVFSFWFACIDGCIFLDILSTYENIGPSISMLLVFIFCAFAYSSCFSEDFENSSYRYSIIRGNVENYVLSKIITICIISIVCMILGTVIFVLSLRFFIQWIPELQIPGTVYHRMVLHGKFPWLLTNNHFILYYICLALCAGLYAAILSIISAWVSLYISNKMLVLTIPVIVYYIIDILSIMLGQLRINDIFIYQGYTVKNTTVTFILILSMTAFAIISMYFAILYKVKGRISNE